MDTGVRTAGGSSLPCRDAPFIWTILRTTEPRLRMSRECVSLEVAHAMLLHHGRG